ncbi:PQQ-binding-like beta-propeller repeat protein [uncultured Draconibacterium sp.]|uniref:outer membrane protein assembly factor BamB family protein n=1 Tax=uncultured Draconibacterium sp. TaxID=1573823 RepID=UPI002AA8C7CD|nr:PQQ-binding-like beta-propeller repeat protein [uncultured Draconibacterium sp.]
MKKINSLFSLIVLLFISQFAISQTVYQWRGLDRDGKYNESGLLDQWPEDGPQLLWSTETLGPGYAAPVITSDKLLIIGVENGISTLFAFDLKGNLLWKSTNGKSFVGDGFSARFPGARSTPTVVGNMIYATSGLGRLGCFDLNTGKELWAVDMLNDLDGYMNEFSYAESVVTDENAVYCFPGGKEISVAKLDRLTGKTIWTSEATGDTTHFVSPILVNLPSRKVFVSTSRHYVFGVDCETGELLWKYDIAIRHDGDHANTPVYKAPYLYVITNDDNGKGAIKLELSADGSSVKEVWTNESVKNDMGGYILNDNKLFVTTENKYLNVMDPETGAVLDKVRSSFGGTIFADNKIIVYGTNGDVRLFNYENGKLTQGGLFKVTMGSQEHFSHPVVANGVLYIRHGEALMAYKIK